jgi:hypothetical protein
VAQWYSACLAGGPEFYTQNYYQKKKKKKSTDLEKNKKEGLGKIFFLKGSGEGLLKMPVSVTSVLGW